ncbi:MAG TPA: gamma-glutamyltransferase, partial [Longimicrobiales bacterium]|nr:gamma-glutamyltransferase [Longimicrobiales bacterium]
MKRIASLLALGIGAATAVGCGAPPMGSPGPVASPGGAPAVAAARPSAEEARPIRPEASGLNGAVVSEHPLATAAGYEVLRAGGNATDAVVTMAAVLAVVRPHMNGVGGDAFGLFYEPD